KLQTDLLAVGGIAGICVGIFVLSFAITADNIGIAFVPEVYTGESIDYWIANVLANPFLSRFLIALIMIGFGAMFISGFALFRLLGEHWQKYVALAGYMIGIPSAIFVFMTRLTMTHQLIVLSSKQPELAKELKLHLILMLQNWHFTAEFVGPVFIVVIGTSFMAWAAKKEKFLPAWLCYWAFLCGILSILYFLKFDYPFLKIAGLGGGPLHMLWFFALGVVLLRRRLGMRDEVESG
ncbi:MAG: DUF4386 family protein, partial [Acidobacteria bacterium]|nr:DUF4386 family protein [Acidobacteriota bacterium]